MDARQLADLRTAVEHTLDEVKDIDQLIDAEGANVDLETLYSYTQEALGALGDLDNLVESLKIKQEA